MRSMTIKLLHGALAALLALAIVACGDDDDGGEATPTTEGSTAPADNGSEDDPVDAPDNNDGEGGSGTVTIDGVEMRFSMDDVTHSQVQGTSDLTFEECDPSFFGAGIYAIGYAVDDAGDLLLDDEGGIAGTLQILFPLTPEDEADTGPPEFDLVYETEGFDLSIAPVDAAADYIPGVESTWTIDGSSVKGSVVVVSNASEPFVADFEVTCG